MHSELTGSGKAALSAHVITETLALRRFHHLLEAEHALGSRQPKGRVLYQVICRGEQWVALVLWTSPLWHFKARDQWIDWDRVTRSERLQLIAHQARFLMIESAREPNLASAVLAVSTRELPGQWEECFGYRVLLAETFTDPESHAGTCYKTSGWEPIGLSRRDGRHYAQKLPEPLGAKKLWVRALHPQARALLVGPQLPEVYRGGLAAHAGERSPLKAAHLRSLCETLERLPDPRSRRARAYPLGAVLALVALGLLRGAVHLSAIVRLAGKLSQSQRRSLGLPFKKSTRFIRVPGYGVYREVLQRLEVDALARELTSWMQSHAGELPRTLAVDGKTIRDHLGLIVTLVDTEDGAPVAVMAHLKGKGHELKTVQKLLRSPEVHLSGAVVTADSLHCQDQTAHLITAEKGGDYVLQVRGNQPTLHAYAQGQLAGAPPLFRPPTAAMGDKNCAN
jgi:hypothetical protein